jgi:hypothetical protein
MTKDEIRELVARVKSGLRITKVIAVRSVRGRLGDSQAGFTAEFSLTEDDSGKPMTLKEAVVANCLLAREADLAAYRNAVAGGNISPEQGADAVSAVKAGYAKLLVEAINEVEGQER